MERPEAMQQAEAQELFPPMPRRHRRRGYTCSYCGETGHKRDSWRCTARQGHLGKGVDAVTAAEADTLLGRPPGADSSAAAGNWSRLSRGDVLQESAHQLPQHAQLQRRAYVCTCCGQNGHQRDSRMCPARRQAPDHSGGARAATRVRVDGAEPVVGPWPHASCPGVRKTGRAQQPVVAAGSSGAATAAEAALSDAVVSDDRGIATSAPAAVGSSPLLIDELDAHEHWPLCADLWASSPSSGFASLHSTQPPQHREASLGGTRLQTRCEGASASAVGRGDARTEASPVAWDGPGEGERCQSSLSPGLCWPPESAPLEPMPRSRGVCGGNSVLSSLLRHHAAPLLPMLNSISDSGGSRPAPWSTLPYQTTSAPILHACSSHQQQFEPADSMQANHNDSGADASRLAPPLLLGCQTAPAPRTSQNCIGDGRAGGSSSMSSLPGCQTSAAQTAYNCDGGNGGGGFFLHSCQASAAQTAHACNGGGGGGSSNLAPLVGCQTSAAPLLQRCNGGDGFGRFRALSSLQGCQKLAAPMTCNAHRQSIGGVGGGCSAMLSLLRCQTSASLVPHSCAGGDNGGGGGLSLLGCQTSAAQMAHTCIGGGGAERGNLAPLVGCQTSTAPLLQDCNGGDGFGCFPALSSLVGCQKLAAPVTCNKYHNSIDGVGGGCSAMSSLLRCQTSASLVPHSCDGGGNGGGGGLSLLGCQTPAAQMAQICGGGGGVGSGSFGRAPLLQPLCGQPLFAADTAGPAPAPLPRLEARGPAAPGRGACISCNDKRMLQLQAEPIAGCPPYNSSVGMHAQTNAPGASEVKCAVCGNSSPCGGPGAEALKPALPCTAAPPPDMYVHAALQALAAKYAGTPGMLSHLGQ